MRWEKQGLVFAPSSQRPWMYSHASLPVSFALAGQRVRVYFASRDAFNRSHIGSLEIDPFNPLHIHNLSKEYILAPGPLGGFDDHGVYAASLVVRHGEVYMYYIGWSPGAKSPLFYSSIGLAISHDNGETFNKWSTVPILSRSEFDPCLVTSPCVIVDEGIWRMWYVSGFKWEENEAGLWSYYNIKYAESKDGIHWVRNGHVCIDHRPGERNIARPCVLKTADGAYKMWYSYNRGDGYRIGYAESNDGLCWTRLDDEVGISPSKSGWDSQTVAYPWVFSLRGRTFMLYNGNNFGKAGFGLAVLQEECNDLESSP